jgi:hypothetical protein
LGFWAWKWTIWQPWHCIQRRDESAFLSRTKANKSPELKIEMNFSHLFTLLQRAVKKRTNLVKDPDSDCFIVVPLFKLQTGFKLGRGEVIHEKGHTSIPWHLYIFLLGTYIHALKCFGGPVTITIFGDFSVFSAKKLAFFLPT